MKKNKFVVLILIALIIILVQPTVFNRVVTIFMSQDLATQFGVKEAVEQIPVSSTEETIAALKKKNYDGQNQVILVNDNQPTFTKEELSLENDHWEEFSPLDILNRVGVANALLSKNAMPTEKRESIADVKPTGWHKKKILFNGKEDYLYNRSHLIGFQLTGQNANIQNLFTGTRALNANFKDEKQSMGYYENLVADYIRETNHHIRYQITPVFSGGGISLSRGMDPSKKY